MDYTTSGFPAHHQLQGPTQTHVHHVSDTIQSSHPLSSSPSPPPSMFPSTRFFSNELFLHIRWPKYWTFSFSISPFMNIQDWFSLRETGWISLKSKGLSRVFSNTTVQKHQFFGAQLSSQSNSHIHTGWQYTALTYSFPDLEPVCCSMSSSNWCFLTWTTILFSRPFPLSSLFLATFNHWLCFLTPFIWEHCGIQMIIWFTVWVFYASTLKVKFFKCLKPFILSTSVTKPWCTFQYCKYWLWNIIC